MPLALALGYAGAFLGAGTVLPQLLRTIRRPELSGVSPVSWGLTSIACLTWLIYGLRAGVLPQVPGNALLISGSVAVMLLVPSPASPGRRAAVLGIAAAAATTVCLLVSPVMIGCLAFCVGLFSLTPQLIDSYATWRGGEESGVSLPTWAMRFATSSCWLGYAVIAVDVPVAFASVIALGTVIAVYAMEASARQVADQRRAAELIAA